MLPLIYVETLLRRKLPPVDLLHNNAKGNHSPKDNNSSFDFIIKSKVCLACDVGEMEDNNANKNNIHTPVRIPSRRFSEQSWVVTSPSITRHASTPNSYVNLSFPDQDIGLMDQSDAEVSRDEILIVSEKLIKWKILLRYLFQGTEEDVEHLIAELEDEREIKRLKLQDVCAKALSEWRKRMGKEATFPCLLCALKKTGRKDLFHELRNKRSGYSSSLIQNSLAYASDSRVSSLSSCISSTKYAFNAYNNGSCSSTHSFVHLPDMPDIEDVFGDKICGKDEAICFKVSNEQRLPEIEELKKALNDPNKRIISLAGHINSGKTIIIDILHREIEESPYFDGVKIIKIPSSDQKDVSWLTRRILESITNEGWLESNHTKSVKRHLKGILETASYQDILLILDLSLIPNSPNGKAIVEFLCDLMRHDKLKDRLTICITSLCSLWNSKLFTSDRAKSYEVVVRTMGHDDAVKFMTDVSPTISRQVASSICKKIECVPFLVKSIAEADIKHFFAAESKEELLKAIDCKLDDLIENVCSGFIGKETLQAVFNCLDEKQKSLLAQVLPFSSEFDVERAARIVDSHINISDISFNCFCEKGALFFSSKLNKTSNSKIYTIPAMLGHMLRSLVQENENLKELFEKAERKHQELYHNLLLHMSSCFMGDLPSKNEELRMLEPFTPSDGVPAQLSIAIDNKDERVKRVVTLFRCHVGDIKNSLKVSNCSPEKYRAALSVATNLRVFYLFSKLLRFHEALEIYRNMKRKARSCENLDTEKLNVFIAAFCIDAYGYKWYSSEARSLLEASLCPLREALSDENCPVSEKSPVTNAKEMFAYCVCRFGTCLLAEYIMKKEENCEDLCDQGIELIASSNEIFEQEINHIQSYNAYIVDSYRILAGFQLETGKIDDALKLVVEKCLKICSEYYGSLHPLTCNCKRLLGTIYRKRELYEKAKNVLLDVFDAEQQLLGEHSDTAKTVSELGLCCLEEFKAIEDEKSQSTLTSPAKVDSNRHLRLSLYGSVENVEHVESTNNGCGIIKETCQTDIELKVTCCCGLNCGGRCLKTQNDDITQNDVRTQDEIEPKARDEVLEQNITKNETVTSERRMAFRDSIGQPLVVERRLTFARFNSSSTSSLYETRPTNESNQQVVETALEMKRSNSNGTFTKNCSWKQLESEDLSLRSDLLIEAKSYFKKAARYSLHVVGKRDDVCENLEHLAEVCGLCDENEQQKKWLERAEEYRQCIIR